MRKGFTPMKTPSRPKTVNKDSLQVYCRLKPIGESEKSCIKVISDTTVQLSVQDVANSTKNACKQYTFKRIYTESNSQKEIFDDIALPLVEQLIKGKNGLLFTYGVTGSGKTYTMTGNKQNVGIMPRCLDVLFNSISDFQCQKYIFKPDRMNGFEVQTEEEAERDREDSIRRNIMSSKLKRKESQEDLLSARSKDGTKVPVAEEDNAYAVFITYIEVYNNYVYDLLDNNETDIISKPQSKLIREDGAGSMYIHGITEVEVKSTEEAFEIFYRGQKRKRMAHTSLNTDSSRSHSVFTIRLVQAPLDPKGETVMQDKHLICISQLSLVDLAGSERTNRTKNTGTRLNEASKINQSLMVLRKCFETLRENQQTNANKMVPYREQKITHLFKNYFEGDGDIRMIVCVNRSMADADENLLVMQFAEASQDIMVKPTPMKDYGIGLTPGRRRANEAYKKTLLQMLDEAKEQSESASDQENHISHVPNDANIIYNFESFPRPEDYKTLEEYSKKLKEYLADRADKIKLYEKDLISRSQNFRAKLLEQVEKFHSLVQKSDMLEARHNSDVEKIQTLEKKVISDDTAINSLKRKNEELLEENKRLKTVTNSYKRKCDEYNDEIKKLKRRAPLTETTQIPATFPNKSTQAVSNPRYGRTQCDQNAQWLDHRPTQVAPMNTVLQPVLRKRKSFDKVTSPKEVRKTSKYCLMTQNQDEAGDIETQFFKGDVVPTTGGGAQIVFNDVETLKQTSPLSAPTSPKQVPSLYPNIESRCSFAIEGHKK